MNHSSDAPAPAQKKKSLAVAFKTQRVPSCQPIFSPKVAIIIFFILSAVLIPLGVSFLFASDAVLEYEVRYDDKCDLNTICDVEIDIDEDMPEPIYAYYGLTNVYQSHRRYVRSKLASQLRGEKVTDYAELEECEPIKSRKDSHNEKNFYYPCGLIAWSLFNDTFQLFDPDGRTVELEKDGIAWETDLDMIYDNPPDNTKGIFVVDDFRDEDFIVWMRTAGLPEFRKLNRIIKEDINSGTYTVRVNNTWPSDDFDGKKYFVLSTTSWMGGKNLFYAYAYLIVGGLCLVLGLIFVLMLIIKPRKYGNTKYISWWKEN